MAKSMVCVECRTDFIYLERSGLNENTCVRCMEQIGASIHKCQECKRTIHIRERCYFAWGTICHRCLPEYNRISGHGLTLNHKATVRAVEASAI
jgi:hypothetical protein